MKHVVVATATDETPVDENIIETVLEGVACLDVVPWEGWEHANSQELAEERIARASAILTRTGVVDEQLMDVCDQLQVVSLHGAGTDQVDITAAKRRGIIVTNVPGGNAQAVAEMTLGLALSMLRGIPQAHLEMVVNGDWNSARRTGHELRGIKWGIIGMGDAGKAVAQLVCACGCYAVYYDPYVPESALESFTHRIYRMSELDRLLEHADVVSVHVPLNEETRHLIDGQSLSIMKSSAFLINVSRGEVINQMAAAKAAHRGDIGGVAIDVFASEPPSSDEIGALTGQRVVLTPHLAGSTHESLTRIGRSAASDIRHVLQGEKPKNIVRG